VVRGILTCCALGLALGAVTTASGAPTAAFTWTPTSPKPGELVTFRSTSTTPSGAPAIQLYEWDLDGDNLFGELGEPSGKTIRTAARVFAASGSFTVRLRVTDEKQGKSTSSRAVAVAGDPPPPPPPPPPPSANRASLLVSVAGNGTALSAPSGISCGSDCAESFPVGTRVTLTATPADGFAFAGWRGACTGTGDCVVVVQGGAVIGARFQVRRALAKPRVPRADGDRDGVRDSVDRCRQTPKGVRRLTRGCSAGETAASMLDALLPFSEQAADLRAELSALAGLKPLEASLKRDESVMRRGAAEIADGAVCKGTATVRRGAAALARTRAQATRTISTLREALQRQPRGPYGDVDARDFRLVELDHRESLMGELVRAGNIFRDTANRVCRALGRPQAIRAKVVETDDANGSVRLGDGTVLYLGRAQGTARLAEGATFDIGIRRYGDGTGIVEKIRAVVPADERLHPAVVEGVKQIEVPCMSLQIAPTQPPQAKVGDYVLHHPRAYQWFFKEGSKHLYLEDQMGLAAFEGLCTPHPADGKGKSLSYRYSLFVGLQHPNGVTRTLANDLTAKDFPVPINLAQLQAFGFGSDADLLVVRTRRQTCLSKLKIASCGPFAQLSETTYPIRMRPFGFWAKAQFEQTDFALEDDPGGFRATRVKSVARSPLALVALQKAVFEAEGYAVVGDVSTRTSDPGAPIKKISLGERFAIYNDDFADDFLLFPQTWLGTDRRSGLRWPRIRGVRDGFAYWYAVELPLVVRDLIAACSPTNSYYRLPWTFGQSWIVGQGAYQVGGLTHQYDAAYDFNEPNQPANQPILAARGGTVTFVRESGFRNDIPNVVDADDGAPPNVVTIRHQDGSLGKYVHMPQLGVSVEEGDYVQRGEQIGIVGNTGYSTGPHLHFEVDSHLPLFEVVTGVSVFNLYVPNEMVQCYRPMADDELFSTNAGP
jgi:hypothetical protein